MLDKQTPTTGSGRRWSCSTWRATTSTGAASGGQAHPRLLRQRRDQLRGEALPRLVHRPGAHAGPQGDDDGPVHPEDEAFSGFVFKIQANMDPKHRDSVAFLRVCSGRFEKDMAVHHARLGTKIRLSRPHKLFARDRETVETAYPGDILGLINPGSFTIGDTVSSGKKVRVRGRAALPAGAFRGDALPEPGEVQAVPEGARAVAAGGRDPGVLLEEREQERADPGGGREAAVRGRSAPDARGVQCGRGARCPAVRAGGVGAARMEAG
jgi:hypothetical protein